MRPESIHSCAPLLASLPPQVRFLEDPLHRPPLSELGWDPLLDMPPLAEFEGALARQRRAIKAALLDQARGRGGEGRV